MSVVLGYLLLSAVAAVVLGRLLKGKSPASMFDDATNPEWQAMSEERRRELELRLIAFRPRERRAIRQDFNRDFTDRSAS